MIFLRGPLGGAAAHRKRPKLVELAVKVPSQDLLFRRSPVALQPADSLVSRGQANFPVGPILTRTAANDIGPLTWVEIANDSIRWRISIKRRHSGTRWYSVCLLLRAYKPGLPTQSMIGTIEAVEAGVQSIVKRIVERLVVEAIRFRNVIYMALLCSCGD